MAAIVCMYFIVIYIVGDGVVIVVGFRERERKGRVLWLQRES